MGKGPVLKPFLNLGHMMTKMGISLPVKCCVCTLEIKHSIDLANYFRAVVPADPTIFQGIPENWVRSWGNVNGGLLWFCKRNSINCWAFLCESYPLNLEKVWFEESGVGFRVNLLNGVEQ